jgi:hypothetical protein
MKIHSCLGIFKLFLNKNLNILFKKFIFIFSLKSIAKFNREFGYWGLGIGDWGLGPIPNPHL